MPESVVSKEHRRCSRAQPRVAELARLPWVFFPTRSPSVPAQPHRFPQFANASLAAELRWEEGRSAVEEFRGSRQRVGRERLFFGARETPVAQSPGGRRGFFGCASCRLLSTGAPLRMTCFVKLWKSGVAQVWRLAPAASGWFGGSETAAPWVHSVITHSLFRQHIWVLRMTSGRSCGFLMPFHE